MNRHTWTFAALGLLTALVLAAFLSPYASSAPDGLERVAADKGFLEKGEGKPLWRHALMPDYVVQKLGDGPASTAVAGLLGTLCAFVTGYALAQLIRRRAKAKAFTPSAPRPREGSQS